MRVVLALFLFAASGLSQDSLAELVTTDIDNFWRAYDASEPGNRQAALQQFYFDPASPGLRDFVRVRGLTAANLSATIERLPKFYASIRGNTLRVNSQRELIHLYLSRFQGLYAPARFPPVYFLIGPVSTGSTVANSGMLVGTEVFSLGNDADGSEMQALNPSFYNAMGSAETLPLIVVHELSHTQQQFRGHATLVSGRTINDRLAKFAEAHRTELFQRFAADYARNPADASNWLYNYGRVTDEPADLGYWIGAGICRDYLMRAPSKAIALENIITMRDPEWIVRNSAYAWVIAPAPSEPPPPE